MKEKKDLRKELKKKLSLISDVDYEHLSSKLSFHLKKFLMDQMVIQKKLIVGAFAPIEREPKWFLSLDDLFENQMAYPAYDGKKMVFKKGKLSELVLNSDFGVNILGPLEKAEIVSPDIFIIPGLGFSKKGKRLGRGKGHYDRALEKSSALKIGVAFDFQVEEDLPTKEYDVLMDFVVTDKKIYKKF